MFNNCYFIAKKDFLYSLKEKTLLMWMFIMPLVFFGFIGSTTGGFAGKSNAIQNIAIWEPVVDISQNNALVKQIIYRLKAENYNTKIFNKETQKQDIDYHFKDYTRRLWIPADIQKQFESGEQITITYATKAKGLGQNQDQFSIEKALYQTLGDILIFKNSNGTIQNLNFDVINNMPKNVLVDTSNAGEKLNIPSGFNQAVPGILVMFILMIALTNGALSLFLERQSGVLKRLAATPLTRQEIVVGKWMGKWFITILQMIYGMLVGWLIFKIHWGDHIVSIIIILMIWAAFSAALAVLLGSIAQSEGQVSLLSTFGALLLAALGGCWWPIEITPQWMQSLAKFLPTGWVMDIMHKLMYFGAQLSDISSSLIILIAASVIALYFANKKFQFS